MPNYQIKAKDLYTNGASIYRGLYGDNISDLNTAYQFIAQSMKDLEDNSPRVYWVEEKPLPSNYCVGCNLLMSPQTLCCNDRYDIGGSINGYCKVCCDHSKH